MSCCPPSSHGILDNADYKCEGSLEKVDDLPLYVVGQGDKCIIWNYDIYGFEGGRTRQHCDLLAKEGYLVVLPDYYRGTWISKQDPLLGDFIKSFDFAKLEPDLERVMSFVRGKGCTSVGAVGTCWGSYVVLKLSSYTEYNRIIEYKCGVSIHPSHPIMCELFGENEEKVLEAVKGKHLFMPAGNDSESAKLGGLAEKSLGERLTIVEFPDMIHGWSIRGDYSDAIIKRDVDLAIELYNKFFKKNL